MLLLLIESLFADLAPHPIISLLFDMGKKHN